MRIVYLLLAICVINHRVSSQAVYTQPTVMPSSSYGLSFNVVDGDFEVRGRSEPAKTSIEIGDNIEVCSLFSVVPFWRAMMYAANQGGVDFLFLCSYNPRQELGECFRFQRSIAPTFVISNGSPSCDFGFRFDNCVGSESGIGLGLCQGTNCVCLTRNIYTIKRLYISPAGRFKLTTMFPDPSPTEVFLSDKFQPACDIGRCHYYIYPKDYFPYLVPVSSEACSIIGTDGDILMTIVNNLNSSVSFTKNVIATNEHSISSSISQTNSVKFTISSAITFEAGEEDVAKVSLTVGYSLETEYSTTQQSSNTQTKTYTNSNQISLSIDPKRTFNLRETITAKVCNTIINKVQVIEPTTGARLGITGLNFIITQSSKNKGWKLEDFPAH